MTTQTYCFLINPDGKIKLVKFCGENDNNVLRWLQKQVGGFIETVPSCFKNAILVVNETGKLDGLEYNEAATALLRADIYDHLCGPVVMLKVGSEDFTGFTSAEIEKIKNCLAVFSPR